MIFSHSAFLYGFKITSSNNRIDVDEGSGEVPIALNIGRYSPQGLMDHIASKLNEALTNTYTVTFNRQSRTVTIAADSTFDLLIATGAQASLSVYSLLGLGSMDLIGGVSYTGGSQAGLQYRPQFRLQNYLSTAHNKRAVDAAVNKSTSGEIEVVSFGEERFMECNIMFITDINQGDGSYIRSNASGVSDALAFMEALIDKQKVDFIPDVTDPATYETLLLERTPESDTGTGFELKEEYEKGLPGYYQTGIMVFRKVI